MYPFLDPLLDRLGLLGKPRYTLEETAEIIGIRRDQVLDLLKRGRLIGKRASERRWGGILAKDLDDYLEMMNAPREKRHRQPPLAGPPVLTATPPTPTRPPNSPESTTPPMIQPIPCSHDPCEALPTNETPDSQSSTKYKLGF